MSVFCNHRQHRRLNVNFPAKLVKVGLDSPIDGVTKNLSQVGTLIKTKNWRTFQLQERVLITIFLPPSFSGQDVMIGLRGNAVITRLEQVRDGIAVKFYQTLRQFERVESAGMPWTT